MEALNPEMESLKTRLKGTWSAGDFGEVQAILTDTVFRQPTRTLQVELNHGDPVGVALHDVEVDYVPVGRRVA